MASILQRYQQLSKLPLGRSVFSKIVGYSAPFFRYLKPSIVELRPAYCESTMKQRWGIQNHLNTINAGALCSMAEMTGGLALDSVVPRSMRWIPRTMTVQYVTKATGTVTAISDFSKSLVAEGDVIIPVVIKNEDGGIAFTADITFYLSQKPPK